jgi:initiation factor 1A
MVKNQTGGNRAKSFARKNESSVGRVERLRLAECDEEIYACVTKLYGNTCAVTTIDGQSLMGHIRKKFSGRGKRTSTITDRCVVLVGLRHWEKEAKNCDILEVYSANEVEQLKNIPKVRFERLLPLIMSGMVVESKPKKIDDAFDFGFGMDDNEIIDTDAADVKEPLSGETFEMDGEQIDIDDI